MKRRAPIGLALALNLLLALPGAASVAPPRNPNSAKGCAICHYRWIDAFFVEGRGTDLVAYQKEKVVATRRMCISCHDGGVKDSRAKLIDHSGHKIDQRPPAGFDIPDIFPLDDKGRLQCATCHTAHGVPSGPDSEETIFMRTSNKDSAMCRMCHPHRDGGLSAGNHPDDARGKAVPPDLTGAGAKTSGRGGAMICETCHTAHGSTFRGFTVQNAGNARLCITCHPDKDIFDPDGSRRPFHAINVAPVNARIPAALFEKGARLGDQGRITCLTCHNIHLNRSGAEHLLVVPQGEKSTFCFTCHPDKAGIAGGRHNMARSRPVEKNLEGRTVSQTGVCSACHLPHKAARDLPAGDNLTTRLCLSCHGQGRIAEKANLAGGTHPLTVNPFQVKIQRSELPTVVIEPKRLELPLFNRSGVQAQAGSGLMTCATCHDTHGPRNGASQQQPSSSEEKMIPHFLRKPSPELCRQCHGNKFSIGDSKHDLKISAPRAKNLLDQTPEQSGLCGGCHLVHGSHKGFLWARALPEDSDVRLKGMCVSCHIEGGIAQAKVHRGYSHPMDVTLAGKGIVTTLPLFDHQSNLSKEGFLTCYTCHDPHAPRAPGEARPSNRLQAPPRFLRLPCSPSPELCTDCHPAMGFVEKTEHDLTVTALAAAGGAAAPGPCGGCHLIHNARNSHRLWALELGPEGEMISRMCRSCHAANGAAAAKIPAVASHPRSDIVNLGRSDARKPDYFPVFDPRTHEPAAVGDITCASCHNVHRWSKASPGRGDGRNTEGDATNSFLRAPLHQMPCKECHGLDALYRYLFFHKAEKRRSR